MNTHLDSAIASVLKERGGEFDEAFKAADRLVAEFGEPGLAERIASEVPSTVQPEIVLDLLGILLWSTRDNEAAIRKQAEQWLVEGKSLRKVQIALGLECYPFESSSQMTAVLKQIAETHPHVTARCEQLVAQRQAEAGA